MKNLSMIISVMILWSFMCCASKAKYFTNYYTGKYTGLDTLINLQGYYISSSCYPNPYNGFVMTMFYNNGLALHNSCNNSPEDKEDDFLVNLYKGYLKKKVYWLQWGSYVIKDDTIKLQTNVTFGFPYPSGAFIEYSDFKLLPGGRIQLVAEYGRGDDWPYDWKLHPDCNKPSVFFPLETKADSTKCPLLKKKWFWDKASYENQKKK